MARLVKGYQETAHVIHISRKILLGFTLVFALSEFLFTIGTGYNSGNYSPEKLNTRIAHRLQSFSKGSHPERPDNGEPLQIGEPMCQRQCKWLQSPSSPIPQLTSGFACVPSGSVWHSSLLILALAPLLRQVLSPRQIFLSYIARGFLAAHIKGCDNALRKP